MGAERLSLRRGWDSIERGPGQWFWIGTRVATVELAMQADIANGTLITYHGETVGSVERVERSTETGQVEALILRSGRSPSLLRIAATFVQPEDAGWRIDPNLQLDAIEQEAMDAGVLPPQGEHLTDAGLTDPSPSPESALGSEGGMPPGYDAPATG